MTGFSALDIVLLLAIVGGIVQGVRRGFTQEILSLSALIVALFAVRLFHEGLSLWLMEIVGSEQGAGVLAYAIIMGVVWGGGKLAAARIGAMIRSGMIGPVDRMLGAGFGALKALLLVTAGFMLVALASDFIFGRNSERPAWMVQSRSYPLLSATGAALSDLVAQRLGRGEADRSAQGAASSERTDRQP